MMQKETDEDTAGIPVGAAQKAPRVAGRWVAAAVVIAMAIGFMVGRIVMGAGTSSVGASSVPSSSPITVRNSPQMTLVPYEGDVTTAEIIQASGDCSNLGDESDAQNLTDETTLTVWRCAGSSQDTELVFDLPSTNSIVGVRITNGNTIDLERYFLQRRLTNVKWLFADGSWVMQGLAANTPDPQELRFPPVQGGVIRLQIVDVTVPGDDEAENDAVAISHLEFLTPA